MSEPITPAMRKTINAMLDQAADRDRRQTFEDLARRLGIKTRCHAFYAVSRVEAAGLVRRDGPRIMFHWSCFKVFRAVRKANGDAALERWG